MAAVERQFEASEKLAGVTEIADDLADRVRTAADQGGGRQNLVPLGALGFFQNIDDFQAVTVAEMGVTQDLEVVHSHPRFGGSAGDEENEVIHGRSTSSGSRRSDAGAVIIHEKAHQFEY